MKYLIINNVYPPGSIGGYELGCKEIVDRLYANGHDVFVITSTYFLGLPVEPYPVVRILQLSSECDDKSRAKCHIVNSRNLEIVDFYSKMFCPDALLMFNLESLGSYGFYRYASNLNIPVVLYLMDNVFRNCKSDTVLFEAVKLVFGPHVPKKNIEFVSMSNRLVKEINGEGVIYIDKYTLIPGWAPDSFFVKKNNSKTDSVKFIFCSRIAPHKGTEILLDSISILIKNNITNFKIDFYGDGMVYEFLSSAKLKGVDKHVSYVGNVSKDHLSDIFSEYDALIFPTWEREPFGFVVSEAMSRGLPAILTQGTGAEEWLNSECCISFSRDANSIADAIEHFIFLSAEDYHDLTSNVFLHAKKYFTFSHCFSVLAELLDSLKFKKFKGKSGNSSIPFLVSLIN